ncbi:MAG TPA: hypothetical protein VEC99_01215, partial [Clostridia bacterium]|nr:hypothetical protein [Clostridia bacterium]
MSTNACTSEQESIREGDSSIDRLGPAFYLLGRALDTLSSSVAILDQRGEILAVNRAWRQFGETNGLDMPADGVGANYLEICDSAQGTSSDEAHKVAAGIRDLIHRRNGEYKCEYPCHSADQQRWFNLRATCFVDDSQLYVLVCHENITKRKLAEDALHQAQAELQAHARTLEQTVNERTAQLRQSVSELEVFSYSISHD